MSNFPDCPEHPGDGWYQIEAGDSLASVARRFATTPLRLLELNPFLDPAELIEGMLVRVPARRALLHAGYGASLEEVLERTGLTRAEFLALNPNLRPEGLLPGQRLNLRPGKAS